MTKRKHLLVAVCLFALGVAGARADDVLPSYPEWNVPAGVTLPEIDHSGGHAVANWFNTHPGCPESPLSVEFTVDKDGKQSGDVTILTSSDIPTLDAAFVRDVHALTFKPATKDGTAIASRFQYGLGVHRLSVYSGPRGRTSTMP